MCLGVFCVRGRGLKMALTIQHFKKEHSVRKRRQMSVQMVIVVVVFFCVAHHLPTSYRSFNSFILILNYSRTIKLLLFILPY